MPTIAGLRRRGYTPEALRLMCERAGTSKAGGWTEYASLDAALRDDLDPKAPRAMAVLDPVELRLDELGRALRQRGASRGLPCAGASAEARARRAPVRARAAPVDRARRLRRGAGQGLLPPLSRQPGAPQVRLRDRVHRLREGRLGARHRGARQRRARHQERHAGRRRGQGQGHDHLGRRRRLRPGRGAALRPPLHRGPARCRRQGLQGEPQPREPARRHRLRRGLARRAPPPSSASRSSATATSSPSGTITRRAGRCSTGSRRCAKPGPPSNPAACRFRP